MSCCLVVFIGHCGCGSVCWCVVCGVSVIYVVLPESEWIKASTRHFYQFLLQPAFDMF